MRDSFALDEAMRAVENGDLAMNFPGYAIVFAVSAVILAYEIFLMGLFALIQWHHFASMIISIALLGFGVSGTVLAVRQSWFVERWTCAFATSAGGFLASLAAATLVLPLVRFNPFQLMWDAGQLLPLLAYYLLLLVPFTLGATVIGLAFLKPGAAIPRVYGANLLGSGAGVFAGLLLGFVPTNPPLSEYKSLSKCLLLPDAKVVVSAAHPLGRMDVVEAPALRIAPGLSLAYRGPMPPQQAIFVNGDGPSALLRGQPQNPEMEFLDWMPSALPYHVARRSRVLVLGAGGGLDVTQAARLGATEVTGLESHPRVASHAGQFLAEARGFVRSSGEKFDLIQISLLESSGAAAAYSLQENYLYTVEAIRDYLACLQDGGMLVITRWLKTPPRDEIRLFATAVRALELTGVHKPGDHLLFARGMQTGALVVKRSPLTATDIHAAQRFCEERLFDLDYFPGIRPQDARRHNKVAGDLYAVAFRELLQGDRAAFFRDYAFDVSPTTDDRPFFSQFFQWRHASELWRLMRTHALPLVEWGYLVSLATLAQTILLSVVLIGLPLFLGKRRIPNAESRITIFLYFAALGLGFMLLEMAMLQKFVLFLASPIYSAAVVIASFLVFAGIGSATAWMRSPFAPLCGVIAIGALELIFLPRLFSLALATPLVVRVLLAVLAIAPLAFFLGMPFPLALRRVATHAPSLVPWAWGINGCLSVVAASLAPLLAIHFGFNVLIALGLGCYFVAALICDRGTLFREA